MYYSELRQVRDELTGPGGPFEIVKAEIFDNQSPTAHREAETAKAHRG